MTEAFHPVTYLVILKLRGSDPEVRYSGTYEGAKQNFKLFAADIGTPDGHGIDYLRLVEARTVLEV
jgi:hypothetical protein